MSSAGAPAPQSPETPAREPATGSAGTKLDLAFAAACVAVTFVVYLSTLGNGFVLTWDDGDFIVRNSIVGPLSASTVLEAFSGSAVHYAAPLTFLSYALDHAIWGPGPFGFHLTNLILHAANAALAFLVALELMGSAGVALGVRSRRWAALLTALAWSLHPLRVETVAWAAERKGVLSLFFGLAAILAYLRHVRYGAPFWRSRWYALALGLFGLSLLAKPLLVTLPVVLAILDAYPLRRSGLGRGRVELAEKIPLLALAAATAVRFTLTANAPLTFSLAEVGIVSRSLVALRSIWDYLRLSVWPSGLSPFYLHPGNVSLGDLSHAVPAALVVVITVVAVVRARCQPAIAAAWLAWLVALVPGLMSTQVSDVAMADRFTYFAGLPLTLLAGAAAVRGVAGLAPRRAIAAAGAIAACLALLASLSVRQISVWRDDVALWSRPIELDPRRSGRVYTQRAFAREQRGDWDGARADMGEAIAIAASKRYPLIHTLYSRRARILVELGMVPDAIADYGRALDSDASPGRAVTLRERAALYAAGGLPELAAADERAADQLDAAP